jgi:hypothetical protein
MADPISEGMNEEAKSELERTSSEFADATKELEQVDAQIDELKAGDPRTDELLKEQAAKGEVVKARAADIQKALRAKFPTFDINNPDAEPVAKKAIVDTGNKVRAEVVAENGDPNAAGSKGAEAQQSIIAKYGPTFLKLIMAIGAAVGVYEAIKEIAAAMSGCYQSNVQQGTQTKLDDCDNDTDCNCQKSCDKTSCIQGIGQPPCGLCAGLPSDNGIRYAYRSFSPADIVGQIVDAGLNVLNSGSSFLSNLLKNLPMYLAYGFLAIVLLFLMYMGYKFVSSRSSGGNERGH